VNVILVANLVTNVIAIVLDIGIICFWFKKRRRT
jgi:hypothetical protein